MLQSEIVKGKHCKTSDAEQLGKFRASQEALEEENPSLTWEMQNLSHHKNLSEAAYISGLVDFSSVEHEVLLTDFLLECAFRTRYTTSDIIVRMIAWLSE